MTITEALLTKPYYGFPTNGHVRRHTPNILAVVHQVAAKPYDGQAMALRNTRNNTVAPPAPWPNTATYYVDQDGDAVHAVDGTKYASWSSGVLNRPDTTNPEMAKVVAHNKAGFNPNECVWEQFECCGTGTEPLTEAQFVTVARLIAARAKLSGLPINRQTVVPHRDFDTVNRPSDPWPAATREARMAHLIALANAALTGAPLESPMYPFVQYAPGHTAVIGDPNDETWIAVTPSPTSTLIRKFPQGSTETWVVTGYVKGEYSVFGASDWWLERWNVDHYEYTAKGNVRSLTPPVTDCTAAVAAATAPLQTQLATAKADLAAAEVLVEAAERRDAELVEQRAAAKKLLGL